MEQVLLLATSRAEDELIAQSNRSKSRSRIDHKSRRLFKVWQFLSIDAAATHAVGNVVQVYLYKIIRDLLEPPYRPLRAVSESMWALHPNHEQPTKLIVFLPTFCGRVHLSEPRRNKVFHHIFYHMSFA